MNNSSPIDTKERGDEIFRKFLAVQRHLRQYARQMDDRGISQRDFAVLRFVLESETVTIGDVKEYLVRSPSVASTVISNLEKSGFVTRTRSTEDNRVVLVALTEKGREFAAAAPLGGLPLLRRKLQTLPPKQLKTLEEAMNVFIALLEIESEE